MISCSCDIASLYESRACVLPLHGKYTQKNEKMHTSDLVPMEYLFELYSNYPFIAVREACDSR